MLTKTDLKSIDNIVQKRITEALKIAFSDFYENVLLPHLDKSEEDHVKIRKEFKEGVGEIGEYIKDHEKRIGKVELLTGAN